MLFGQNTRDSFWLSHIQFSTAWELEDLHWCPFFPPLNYWTERFTNRLSKSSSRRWESPVLPRTSTLCSSMKSTATQINDQQTVLTNMVCFHVKAISHGSISGLIDNTNNIKTSNRASILCSLPLRVIKLGRNSNHCILHSDAKEGFSNLTHLSDYYYRNFFSNKPLFTLVTNHNHGLVKRTSNNLEWAVLDITLNNNITKSPPN